MPPTGEALTYSNPPVRQVELAIYFQPIEGLKLTSMAPLVTSIRETFPETVERFAFAPWNLEEAAQTEPSSFRQAGYLPFPWLAFSDGHGKTLGFQGDRFSVQWEFRDGADYPGFEELRGRLLEHFKMFRSHVERETQQPVFVSHGQCEYVNDFDQVHVLRIAALAEEFEIDLPVESSPRSHGSIYNRDFGWDEGEDVRTDLELFAFAPPGEITRVTIRSTARRIEPVADAPDSLIERAHARLIDTFELVSTDKQREGWGRHDGSLA